MSTAATDEGIRVLEAVRSMAAEYGLAAGSLKPCIAALLDGNLGAARHDAAFVLAIEFRRLGFTEKQVDQMLARWARSIGYERNLRTALQRRVPENAGRRMALPPAGPRQEAGNPV